MRRPLLVATLIATVGALIVGILALSGVGQQPFILHSGTPETAKAAFLVRHDGNYGVAYDLHQCEGTLFILANVTVGGLSAPLPNQFEVVSATRANQTGTITLPLYYGNWQVIEFAKPNGCTWTMSVSGGAVPITSR
jgi:hypothetical protein